jgi:hypothetical protein
MENPQADKNEKGLSIAQQWINQHCSLERYTLAFFIPFRLLRRFQINPQSKFGKSIIFILFILLIFGLPLTLTAIMDQWDQAPLKSWIVIGIVFGLLIGTSYDIYYKIGLNVCSIGHTVVDEKFFYRQINWDRYWFNLRIGGTVGLITSVSMLISLLYINHQTLDMVIPWGNLLVICFLAYQIGELACNNLLMCFEARNFSKVDHSLFRFNPIETESIHSSFVGYNQFALVTSLVMTVFIVCSVILLPNSAYLTNPVWLFIIFAVYSIVILAVIVPRYFVQQIIRKAKHRQLTPIRQKLNNMFDRLMHLSDEEYNEMLRLIDIQDLINKAPDSSLPFSTIGRIFGTLILPTISFILAVLGEAYISTLLQRVFEQVIH